jgi:hypothetical protein
MLNWLSPTLITIDQVGVGVGVGVVGGGLLVGVGGVDSTGACELPARPEGGAELTGAEAGAFDATAALGMALAAALGATFAAELGTRGRRVAGMA